MLKCLLRPAIKFGNLLRRQLILQLIPNVREKLALFPGGKFSKLLKNFSGVHGLKLPKRAALARGGHAPHPPGTDPPNPICRQPSALVHPVMIPREILKKIRQIELRTNRLVSETLAGQYHSVFKGQGMNFDEVREYQPGDDIRAIDWNVTARMNHPFIKKFVEERELTLMLVVDLSGSGLFGSGEQSKREMAAEIASVLAFSAIRNNDKVGLILFTEEVEKFIPPRKGRRHVLRVIREILLFEPRLRGTNLNTTLQFLRRVTNHRAIVVLLSDFLGQNLTVEQPPQRRSPLLLTPSLAMTAQASLRQTNRRHDVVAIHIVDRFELELPALGRLVFKDAETGEVIEINTADGRKRKAFAERQTRAQGDILRALRSANVDTIQVFTNQPYAAALGRFFQAREKRRRHG
jgi:uncharacterized protein (DUF58 family)